MKRIVTAVFETSVEAERARDRLRALGVPPDSIDLHARPEQQELPASDTAPGSEPGLPALLDMLFGPDPQDPGREAVLVHGAVAVTARVEPDAADAAARALEAAGGRYTRNATQPASPTS